MNEQSYRDKISLYLEGELKENELNDFISEKLMEREVFYKKAHHILPAKNISKTDIIKLIS